MSLMICIPSYDGKIHFDTARGVAQTVHYCATNKIGISVDIRPHDAFIGKARSIMAEKFLKSGFNDLLYVDADIGFGIEEVRKVCTADCDIAMGLYRMKQDGPDETKLIKFPALMFDPIERNEKDPFLIKLRYGPAGFLRVRRNVFETMMKQWPDETWEDETGTIHDFFPCGRQGNNFNGEDISFCNRAQECGFDIWGVQGLNLRHYGEKRWPSTWQIDVLEPVEAEAA